MLKLRDILLFFLLLQYLTGYAQKENNKPAPWRLLSYSGSVDLNAYYNYIDYTYTNISDRQKSTLLSAGIRLNATSYIWHPRFLTLGTSIGFEPTYYTNQVLIGEDDSNTKTFKLLRVSADFFKNHDYNLHAFYDFNENFMFRENLRGVKSKNEIFGADFNYTNKYLPFNIKFHNSSRDQREQQINRDTYRQDRIVELNTYKSFSKKDFTELNLSRKYYLFQRDSVIANENIVKTADLRNDINFDQNRNYILKTRFNYYDMISENRDYNRISFSERLNMNLPENLRSNSFYSFVKSKQINQELSNHNFHTSISHQLYSSLFTELAFNYRNSSQTYYNQKDKFFNLHLAYVKKIPLNGELSINYRYRKQFSDRQSETTFIPILNELIIINDNEITLLEKANVKKETVIVKDITLTIIYQENIDYFLLEFGELIEIKRIPGGLIQNNESLLIDYIALQPESFDLIGTYNNLKVNVTLFKNKFQLFYGRSNNRHNNPEGINSINLDVYNRNFYGTSIRLGGISGEVIYDVYDSQLMPYRSMRYKASFLHSINQKINFNLSLDITDYLMIQEEGDTQIDSYFNGTIIYNLNHKSNIRFAATYRNHEGDRLNLGWLTGKCEFNTRFNQLFFKAEVNYYNKHSQDQQESFAGIKVQVTRRF